MCFGCDECGYCIGNILYVSERLASCCAMTAVVCCLVATLLVMLATGIGVGYNYCFVDFKMATTTESEISTEVTVETAATDKILRNGQNYYTSRSISYGKRSVTSEYENTRTITISKDVTTGSIVNEEEIKPTMVVPLRKLNLQSLITRLMKNNQNFTLELIQ